MLLVVIVASKTLRLDCSFQVRGLILGTPCVAYPAEQNIVSQVLRK